MRVNVDEKIFNDARIRRLTRLMGWPHVDFAIGAIMRLWMASLNRVSSENPDGLISRDDAEDTTDIRGLVDAVVESGLAEPREDGRLYFNGIRERAEFLLKQRAKGKSGGQTRWEEWPRLSESIAPAIPANSHGHPETGFSDSLLSVSGSGSGSVSGSGSPAVAGATRKKGKSAVLDRHRAVALRLWELQSQIRADVIPGAKRLEPTDERLQRVADRLEAGASEDECIHVLRVYEAECRAKPESRQWFDGVTNWRRDNFDRALGKPLTKPRQEPGDLFANARGA